MLIGISLALAVLIVLLFAEHMWVFIVAVGLFIFAVSYAVLSFKGSVIVFLKQKSDERNLALAVGLSAAVCSTLWLVYIFGGHLAAMAGENSARIKSVDTWFALMGINIGSSTGGNSWFSNADYIGAAATIIGAGISLIPIFGLIRQNMLMREQNKSIQRQIELQRAQNSAAMLSKACELLQAADELRDTNDILSRRVKGLKIRAAIPLLRAIAMQENERLAWAAVKTLTDIPKVSGTWGKQKYTLNVISALMRIGICIDKQKCKSKKEIIKLIVTALRCKKADRFKVVRKKSRVIRKKEYATKQLRRLERFRKAFDEADKSKKWAHYIDR